MKEISAGGVVYRQSANGRYEIQMIRDRYGKMTLAKGKMEAGETIEQTALREIVEETGAVGNIVAPLAVIEYDYQHPQHGLVNKEVHYFLVVCVGGETQVQVEEIHDVHWLDAQTAWRLQVHEGYDNNDQILRAALLRLNAMSAGQFLACYIDHTILKADVGPQQIEQLCLEARAHAFYSVCVHTGWVKQCQTMLSNSSIQIAAVCGFPFGADATLLKAREAAWSAEQGASEIDMVLPVGQLLAGNHTYVEQDIREVVKAAGGKLVKVIMETGYLNDEQKRLACQLSEAAGAHYVKTSTGFGPGGATIVDIALMRAAVGSRLGVKASGGVRDLQTAEAMIQAGATRIGTSSGIAIVSGSTTSNASHY